MRSSDEAGGGRRDHGRQRGSRACRRPGLRPEGIPGGPAGSGLARLEATRAEVEGYGVRCMAIPTDVADADAVEDAAARIEAGLGPVDVWVNSAMTSVFSPVHQLEAEEMRRVVEVTYLGSVNGILTIAAHATSQRGNHCPGRLGAGLPSHSAPSQLLRLQVRHPRLRRLTAL